MMRSWGQQALCALTLATVFVSVANAQAQEPEGSEVVLNNLGDGHADLVYTPLAPCRIIDTRLAGGAIAAGTTRSFLVTGNDYSSQGGGAASCGVPAGVATAAMINFVAVDAVARGNLQVTPYGQPIPLASIINYTAGLNLANGLVVAICNPSTTTCTSDITIKANVSAAHLVADVQGYFRKTPAVFVNSSLADTALGEGALVSNTTGYSDTAVGASALSVNTTGYGNSAVGHSALQHNTTGNWNSAVGTSALSGNTTGNQNSAFGSGALQLNTTGYDNSAVGAWALQSNTTGHENSAFGSGALHDNSTGYWNAAVGTWALFKNTTGYENAAFGQAALSANTTGNWNSAFGTWALFKNTTGYENAAFGQAALNANTTGNWNSAFGAGALNANTTGYRNAAAGRNALVANTTGYDNSAFGTSALSGNTTGVENSAVGTMALRANTTGYDNSAIGTMALFTNTTGYSNSAVGAFALNLNTTGHENSASGTTALQANVTGHQNSAFGMGALYSNAMGIGNVAVGYQAGYNLTSGNDNIYIANTGASTESGVIRIGTTPTHTATYIAGISVATVSGSAVYVNSNGQLGTLTSSRRYKDEIVDMDAESDVLMRLRPVSFYYRPELDETHTRQFGLVAEEVAELAPELVARDETGAPQTVRYHFVNAMLLNEVQEQRRRIQDLEARLAKLEAALAGNR